MNINIVNGRGCTSVFHVSFIRKMEDIISMWLFTTSFSDAIILIEIGINELVR